MLRFHPFAIVLVLAWHGSQAVAGPLPDEKPAPAVTDAPQGVSELNRQTRNYGLWAGFGVRTADMAITEGSVEAAYFLKPNELLSIRISRLTASEIQFGFRDLDSTTGSYVTTAHMEAEGNTLSVNWKSFLSNSFYLKAGLEQFRMSAEYYTSDDNRRRHLGDLSRQNALFALGNQWQWRGFTMGCDWGGFTYPIAYRYVSHYDDVESTMTNKFIRQGDKTLANLLYFYLGGTF